MFGYLKGKIVLKGKNFLIVETGGVGYKVFLSKEALKRIKEKDTIEVFVRLCLKRETIELYGCLDQKEFELFEFLEKMPGIGPKTALPLASIGSLEELKKAVDKKDDKLFKSVKGMGLKRRQRLILELTGQLKDLKKGSSFEQDEAFKALLALGFPKKAAAEALLEVPEEIKETQQRVQEALKILRGK